MKKLLAILLSAVFMFSMSVCAFAGYDKADGVLRFNEDGSFKILCLADIQDACPVEEGTIQFINEVLDSEQPDLVVLVGDNIVTSDLNAYDQIFAPLISRGVYFTFVFGNHDEESSGGLTKDEMLEIYIEKGDGYCLAYDAIPALHGTATHNLPILASDGSDTAKFNLWMFDSGSYTEDANGNSGYDCVHKDQLDWYKAESARLAAANGGIVPSIAFQHIIVAEIMEELYYKVNAPMGKITKYIDGQNYLLVPTLHGIANLDGFLLEPPCPGVINEGQLDAHVETGDVLGIVTGHDHVNSYIYNIDGIDLIQTAGATLHSYGDDMVRGARVITIDESDPWGYETSNITYSELMLSSGSELAGLSNLSKFASVFAILGNKIVYALEKVFQAMIFFVD